jgi:DNA (cytosine-5)-methyltransferase 1
MKKNFGKGSCSNIDITKVDLNDIPEHDLLVGGFPCQDYSVAKSLKYSSGIEGKKGVLWWEIIKIVDSKNPPYILLENVDRLLSSPSKQKGRDFAIILKTLQDRNYYVEWRVINAAEYGFPQKRKRIFIFATKKNTLLYSKIKEDFLNNSLFNNSFPVIKNKEKERKLEENLLDVSNKFGKNEKKTFFENAGYLDKNIITYKTQPILNKKKTVLKDIVLDLKQVPSDFLINEIELEHWKTLKLGRKIERINKKTGFKYIYREGKMAFPDKLENPARTIITSEGGKNPSRFKHIIQQNGIFRRLTPIELERINMFPDNHTEGVSDTKRAFLMGNSLVTGVIEQFAKYLIKKTEELSY